jgi:hypothetical protein
VWSPAPNLEAEVAYGLADRTRATDRARRAVEAGEETVTGRVELASAEAVELSAYERVMRRNELGPLPIADVGRLLRRIDDVGEEHRREDRLRLGITPDARHETLDFLADARGDEEHGVLPCDLDSVGAGDAVRDLDVAAPRVGDLRCVHGRSSLLA